MKKIITTTFGILALLGGIFFFSEKAEAIAVWNMAPNDFATVRVSNVTKQPNCSTCWSQTISADPGDTIAVSVYYHNTGSTIASDTVIRLSPQSSGQTTSVTFNGSVSSLSAQNTASGSATASITSPQPLNFVTARWFPNQTTTSQMLPGGQDGSAAFGSGINIGTVSPGWNAQGSVVFHFVVGANNQNNPPPVNNASPVVVTNPATGVSDTFAQLNGILQSTGNSATSVWFEYGPTYSLGSSTGSRNGYVGGFQEGISGLQPNTIYYFRAVARNASGISYGNIVSFYTSGNINPGPSCPLVDTVSAVAISQTSAVANGLVIGSSATPVTAWFEYGPTQALGFTTAQRSLGTISAANFSAVVSGLQPGTRYYYRAVIQTNCGTVRDTTSRFFTTSSVSVVNPVVVNPVVVRPIVANSTPSLFALRVDTRIANACINGDSEYVIYWKNVSSQTLSDAVLQVNIPEEMGFVRASTGSFSEAENVLTVPIGQVSRGQEGSVTLVTRILPRAEVGQLLVVTSTIVYTNPTTGAQEDAIAYALTTVTRDCPNLLGAASLFGANFWPDTLLEWLFLILIILALIVLGRRLYQKRTI